MPSMLNTLIDFRFTPWQAYYWPATLHALATRRPGRRFRHMTLANPGLPEKCLLLISKIECVALLDGYGVASPPAAIVEQGRVISDPSEIAGAGGPVYVKPEFGLRSIGVSFHQRFCDALAFCKTRGGRYLLQPAVPGPEYTAMFLRGDDGQLALRALVQRTKLIVEGDGVSTLGALVRASGRGRPSFLKRALADQWDSVPARGEQRLISRMGVHSWGARFDVIKTPPAWCEALRAKLDQAAGLNYFKTDIILGPGDTPFVLDLNGAFFEPLDAYDEPIDNWRFIKRFSEAMRDAMDAGYRETRAGASLPGRRKTLRQYRGASKYVRAIQ